MCDAARRPHGDIPIASGEGRNGAGHKIHVRHGQEPAMGLAPDGTKCSGTVRGVSRSPLLSTGENHPPARPRLCDLPSAALGRQGEKAARLNPPSDCGDNYKMLLSGARPYAGRLGGAAECCSLLSCSVLTRSLLPAQRAMSAQALQGGDCWSSGALRHLVKVTTKPLCSVSGLLAMTCAEGAVPRCGGHFVPPRVMSWLCQGATLPFGSAEAEMLL